MDQKFFQTLKQDHEEVKEILGKLMESSEGATKKKEDLFLKLKQELIPHMRGEEKHFYPALREEKESRENALEALEEHHVAEIVLKELDKLAKGDETWSAKLKVFKEILEHHIEEEEEEIFETAENVLDEDEIEKIMKSFEQEKEKEKKKIAK